jgi:hypothetical protein
MVLLWCPGEWALWSSGEEGVPLAELGEWMDTGALTVPVRSSGNQLVTGLKLWRPGCDMVVRAVEVMSWAGAAEVTAGYE